MGRRTAGLPTGKTLAAGAIAIVLVQAASADAGQRGAPAKTQMAPASRVGALFNGQRLGRSVTAFDRLAGRPSQADGQSRTYVVDGCTIYMDTQGGRVTGLTLEFSRKCRSAGLWGIGGDWTFAKMEKRFGRGVYAASCLEMCPNAYDSDVYLTIEGRPANGRMAIQIGAEIVNGPMLTAADNWRKAMAAEGRDYVIETRFACDRKYDAVAHRLFGDLRVTWVSIGKMVTRKTCA